MLKKILHIFLFIAFILAGSAGHVWSANLPFINKAKIRVTVKPGEQIHGDLTIENPTSEDKSMRLYLEDWYYASEGDGTKIFLPGNSLTRSCASWITFSPAEFTISPFGKQRVSYSIKVPDGSSGGYYAALFFETLLAQMGQPEGVSSAGINLTVRIASLFYVEAEGTIKKAGFFDNLNVRNENTNGKNLAIEIDFKNTGNTDITAGGTFHIMDKDGMVYARGEFSNGYTFPQDKARLFATWKSPLPEGRYDLILTLDLGKALEELGLGRGPVYTKETNIEIGPRGEVIKVGDLK